MEDCLGLITCISWVKSLLHWPSAGTDASPSSWLSNKNSHCSCGMPSPAWCLFPMIHHWQLQDLSDEKKVFPPQPQAYISKANDTIPVLLGFLDLFVELDLTRVLFCCFCVFKCPKVSVRFVSTISCGDASLNRALPGPSYCLGWKHNTEPPLLIASFLFSSDRCIVWRSRLDCVPAQEGISCWY